MMAELKFGGTGTAVILPRLAIVQPYAGESISHFLGRVRRVKANSLLSGYSLGKLAGLGGAVARWEKLYLNPRPTGAEIDRLAAVLGINRGVLAGLFPGAGMGVSLRPIRLCGACYGEVACHRMQWQYKWAGRVTVCDRHGLHLLMKCPNCGTGFLSPGMWADGCCGNCGLGSGKMVKWQRSVRSAESSQP